DVVYSECDRRRACCAGRQPVKADTLYFPQAIPQLCDKCIAVFVKLPERTIQPSAQSGAGSERGEKIHRGGRARNSLVVLSASLRPFWRGVGRRYQFWKI